MTTIRYLHPRQEEIKKQRRPIDPLAFWPWLFLAAFTAWVWIEIIRGALIVWDHCFCAFGL